MHRLHMFVVLFGQHRPPVVECQGLLHRAGPLCLAFLMVACASQDSTAPLGYDEARAKHLFSEGYQDVSDIYIEEVDRKSVVSGKSVSVRVEHGGRRIIKKKRNICTNIHSNRKQTNTT